MIRLVTDSASDLSSEMIAEYGLYVAPLLVHHGTAQYLDGETILAKRVFDEMRQGKVFKTAQVTPESFLEIFNGFSDEDQVLYLAFSSELSGTYNSGLIARDLYREEGGKARIEILDTRAASGGIGLIVREVAKRAREGADFESLLTYAEELMGRVDQLFTVDDLEYLFRGGRVSRSAAFMGGLLNIKPVLEIADGKLVPLERARGRLKSIKRLCELMGERSGGSLGDQTILIHHGDDLEAAHKLREMIRETYGIQSFVIHTVGSVIGAHSGPGTLAVFYLKPKAESL